MTTKKPKNSVELKPTLGCANGAHPFDEYMKRTAKKELTRLNRFDATAYIVIGVLIGVIVVLAFWRN